MTETVAASQGRPGVLSLSFKEKAALFAAYMPFVKGGGLFIPTNKALAMGEEVFMLLSLPDDADKLKVVGKVVWITPVALNQKPQGVGIQFSDQQDGVQAKKRIEAILGGALKSSRNTHTL